MVVFHFTIILRMSKKSKWGKIIVQGLPNQQFFYPLDEKEKNIVKFPKKKRRNMKQAYEKLQIAKEELPPIDEIIQLAKEKERNPAKEFEKEINKKVDLPPIDELIHQTSSTTQLPSIETFLNKK